MIYDSIRQAKPAIRNTFGVGRFNTRLNFYFFEINRLNFLQKKNMYSLRVSRDNDKHQLSLLDIESLDTTLFSYRFFSSKKKTI
jgi:hypothetical protein